MFQNYEDIEHNCLLTVVWMVNKVETRFCCLATTSQRGAPCILHNPVSLGQVWGSVFETLAGGQAAGLFPLITCSTEQTLTPLPTVPLPAGCNHSSPSLFIRQGMKFLTSKLLLLCLLNSRFLTKEAGAPASHEKGSRGAERRLLHSQAFLSEKQWYKDGRGQLCR